jgi:hypothetical protein
MKKQIKLITAFIAIFIFAGMTPAKKTNFIVEENSEGIKLLENGNPVFFYQREPKGVKNLFSFNNYLHPVYNLQGDNITEEFPADHLHHRGIFWAWHQIYIDNKSIGDQWMMENISQEVARVKKKMSKKIAQFNIDVLWKSSAWQNGKPFVEENTTITVHRSEVNIRKIDFEIVLKPLTTGVQLGGSDDEKGYGGFCVRVKLPENTVFTSEKGRVTPQNLQIISGPWMDISSSLNSNGKKTGLAILCHKSTPNYPEPWILRQERSMQNVVFPGRERTKLDNPVTLRYRVVIHNGDANTLDLSALQAEYNKMYKGK